MLDSLAQLEPRLESIAAQLASRDAELYAGVEDWIVRNVEQSMKRCLEQVRAKCGIVRASQLIERELSTALTQLAKNGGSWDEPLAMIRRIAAELAVESSLDEQL